MCMPNTGSSELTRVLDTVDLANAQGYRTRNTDGQTNALSNPLVFTTLFSLGSTVIKFSV